LKICILFIACLTSLFGCAAQNVSDLRSNAKIHKEFISTDSLQNVYGDLIKKYNECGVPISNNFINSEKNEAAISYSVVGYGWYAHADLKIQSAGSVRVDAYSVSTFGTPAAFVNMTELAIKKISGCPQ